MDSFEINKIIAAILLTALIVIGIGKFTDILFHVDKPKVSAYKVDGLEAVTGSSEGEAEKNVNEKIEVDIGQLLAMGDLAHGQKVFKKCSACHMIVSDGKNIVKVLVKNQILNEKFLHAIDFFRDLTQSKNIYHHIGIYGFTKNSLSKFVNFKRSKLEIERKLEQLRALENGMSVHVGLTKSLPLSVDTDKDLEKIKKIMENDKT